MAGANPQNKGRCLSLAGFFLFLFVTLFVAAFGGSLYWAGGRGRFTLFEQDAGDLLDQLITDSKLPISQVDAEEQLTDGSALDTARRMLITPFKANAVRAGFRQGCRRAGLGAPDALTLGSEPDALCEGAWRGGTATVSVQLHCAQSCRAVVTVYHSWV